MLMKESGKMRRHRKTRRQTKKQRKIIIISLICFMFIMVGGYSAFQTNLNIIAKGNIKEKSRVIQSWTSTSNEDFHTDYYRENIVSATFLDTSNVPYNATESWNVSEDKEHGGVMAWVIPNEKDNTKYDLYIGANKGVIANEDSSYLFYNFINAKTIEFNNNMDTSQTVNMLRLFTNCRELTYLDLSSFNTEKVSNMSGMFLSTSSTDFMKIETIIFGDKFTTNNVNNMAGMFGNCKKLKNLNISMFDTSRVTNMSDMFSSCSSLTELNISNFNTEKVMYMQGMFWNCDSLTILNLCSFNTSNVVNMNIMFGDSANLLYVYVGHYWITDQVDTDSIFINSKISSVTTGQC